MESSYSSSGPILTTIPHSWMARLVGARYEVLYTFVVLCMGGGGRWENLGANTTPLVIVIIAALTTITRTMINIGRRLIGRMEESRPCCAPDQTGEDAML
jgi:hypothetical protein